MKTAFHPEDGHKPVGPYSPGIRAGDFVYVSGQGPIEPSTGKLIEGDIFAQTCRTLENVKIVLEAAGCTFADVVKSQVHLLRLEDFREMNRAYAQFFPEPYPARTTVQSGLLGGMLVEIDCVAYKPD